MNKKLQRRKNCSRVHFHQQLKAAPRTTTTMEASAKSILFLLLLISCSHLLSFAAQLGATTKPQSQATNPAVNNRRIIAQPYVVVPSPPQQQQQASSRIIAQSYPSSASSKQQQQSTVITHESRQAYTTQQQQQPSTNHFVSPLHRQPSSHHAHHFGDNQAAHFHLQQVGNRLPGGHQESLCQVSPGERCAGASSDADSIAAARAEFKIHLEDSSLELKRNLNAYWKEFRDLSLDLVHLAHEGTMRRLKEALSGQQLNESDSQHYAMAIHPFFDSMSYHLTGLETVASSAAEYGALPLPESRQTFATDISEEIDQYFRRMHLIHLKRLLERARKSPSGNQPDLDLECMSRNLNTQPEVDRLIQEFQVQDEQGFAELMAEQQLIAQSIKQSLEFARTLLQSLYSARGIFQNLTERTHEWMPSQQCHRALARMTVCGQNRCPQGGRQTSGSSRGAGGFQLPLAESAQLPCENYCLNVVRGCMNDVYELNRYWSSYASALGSFKQNMIQMNNIENVMSSLDEKLLNFMIKLQQQYTLALESSPLADSADDAASSSSSSSSSSQDQQPSRSAAELESAKVSKLARRAPRKKKSQ